MRNLISLRLNKEFKRAYFQGKFRAGPAMVTYLVKNRTGVTRVGITTGKKVGNDCCRSRARRIIRAAWISIREEFPQLKGYDLVFLARPPILKMKSTELAKLMKKQLQWLFQNGKKK